MGICVSNDRRDSDTRELGGTPFPNFLGTSNWVVQRLLLARRSIRSWAAHRGPNRTHLGAYRDRWWHHDGDEARPDRSDHNIPICRVEFHNRWRIHCGGNSRDRGRYPGNDQKIGVWQRCDTMLHHDQITDAVSVRYKRKSSQSIELGSGKGLVVEPRLRIPTKRYLPR